MLTQINDYIVDYTKTQIRKSFLSLLTNNLRVFQINIRDCNTRLD